MMLGIAVVFDGLQMLITAITTGLATATAAALAATIVGIPAAPVVGISITAIGAIASWLLGATAGMTFLLWFSHYHIHFSTVRVISYAAGGIVELVPYANMIPAWTMTVGYFVLSNYLQTAPSSHTQTEV